MKHPALMTTAAIRAELKKFVMYDHGELLRTQLKLRGAGYGHKNRDTAYLSFLNANPTSFEENHPQSSNHPYVWTMFSCVSQDVMGDSVEECLDKAIAISKKKRHR